jgi:hypothetical protein
MEAKRDLGRRLKTLRKRAALTQEDLAERAGLNPKYISGIERGRENPTPQEPPPPPPGGLTPARPDREPLATRPR